MSQDPYCHMTDAQTAKSLGWLSSEGTFCLRFLLYMQRGEDKDFKHGHRGIESAQRQLLKDIAQARDM